MKKNKFVYKCELCSQKYTTKYIYERHLLMCRLSLNSNKETDAELEELKAIPSHLELYKIVQELYIKQNKMQKQIEKFEKYIQQKKKKINILSWLHQTYLEDPTVISINDWLSNLNISDLQLQTVFDTNLINGALNIILEHNVPIKCFESRTNQFYVYDTTWKMLSNSEFDNILQTIIKSIYAKFSSWFERQRQNNSKIQDLYCKYCNKLFNGKQNITSQNRTIKSRFYKQTKLSLKEIYEYEFEF